MDNKWAEYLDKQTELLNKGVIDEKQYNDAVKNASVGMKGHSEALQASTKQLGNSLLGLGSSLVKGAQGASVYNNTINSGADVIAEVLSAIPFVGKLLGVAVKGAAKFVTAVNEQADALHDTYQDISRSGLVTGMDGVFKDLHSMGYTMKEIGNMGALLKENSTTLATLGGTAAQGTNKIAAVSKEINYSNAGYQLKLMGMSVDDINRGTIQYVKLQQTLGLSTDQTNKDLANASVAFIEQQDRLTKLTGLNAEEQNKVLERAYNSEQYNARQKELRDRGDTQSVAVAESNDAFLQILQSKGDEKLSSAFQSWSAGGLASPEAKQFERALPLTAKAMKDGVTDIGILSQLAAEDAKETARLYGDQGLMGNADKQIGSFAGILKLSGSDLRQSNKDSVEAAKTQQNKQKAGQDPATKAMVDLTASQRNQTMAFEQLANKALPSVTSGVSGFTKALDYANEKVLAPVAGKEDQMGPGATPGSAVSIEKAKGLLKYGGDTGSADKFDTLSPKVKNAFLAMVAEYGKPVTITSARRNTSDQERIYDAWLKAGGSPSNPIVKTEYGTIKMPAKPGTSLHEKGKAIDLDTSSFSALSGLFGKYGFQTVAGDPGHIQMPSADTGNILSGPMSGFKAMLHGTEAVVPLPKENSIPVEMEDYSTEELMLMNKKILLLDQITEGMKKYNTTYENIIRVHT